MVQTHLETNFQQSRTIPLERKVPRSKERSERKREEEKTLIVATSFCLQCLRAAYATCSDQKTLFIAATTFCMQCPMPTDRPLKQLDRNNLLRGLKGLKHWSERSVCAASGQLQAERRAFFLSFSLLLLPGLLFSQKGLR